MFSFRLRRVESLISDHKTLSAASRSRNAFHGEKNVRPHRRQIARRFAQLSIRQFIVSIIKTELAMIGSAARAAFRMPGARFRWAKCEMNVILRCAQSTSSGHVLFVTLLYAIQNVR